MPHNTHHTHTYTTTHNPPEAENEVFGKEVEGLKPCTLLVDGKVSYGKLFLKKLKILGMDKGEGEAR
jgi:hypothetical protein